MVAGRGGRDGHRSGADKVDDDGDEARGRDARIPVRRSDERGRSLVMDDGVGVSAPAWWRRKAVDGVADGGGWRRVGWRGCFGAHEVRMGKRLVERKEVTMYSGRACLKCEEIYKLSPRFKFLLHHSNISRLGIGR